jgi:hypothetical protein
MVTELFRRDPEAYVVATDDLQVDIVVIRWSPPLADDQVIAGRAS